MTIDEFIKEYCKKSNITLSELNNTDVVLPCSCGDESCKGWAVVSNNKLSIKSHNSLYNKALT